MILSKRGFMMEQKIQLLTKQAPPPAGPYSQGIETEQFVFVSGQRPVDPVTGEMKNGIKSQTEQVIKNVECVLKEAGCTLADIVRSTVSWHNTPRSYHQNKIYRTNIPLT